MRTIYAVWLGACVLAAGTPALADPTTFKTSMTSQAEVPPNASTGNGTLEATFDPATKKLEWKGSYSGLSGPVTASHFHGPAETGANAAVVLPVDAKTPSFSGSAALTEKQAADLMAGKWYFNVHTDQNKGGEIRGQLAPVKTR